MAEMWQGFKNFIWAESFWLPPDADWSILKRNETVYYPAAEDLWIPFPMAIGLFIARLVWERYVTGRHMLVASYSRFRSILLQLLFYRVSQSFL